MNTRRLTKKYKNKSKSKKTRKSRRSKRRVLKGGVSSVSRASSGSVRPSSGVVIHRTSGASGASFRPSSSAGVSKNNFNFECFYKKLLSIKIDKLPDAIKDMKEKYTEQTTIRNINPTGAFLNMNGLKFVSYLHGKYKRANKETKKKIRSIISLFDQCNMSQGVRITDLAIIEGKVDERYYACYKKLYNEIYTKLFPNGNSDCFPVSTSAVTQTLNVINEDDDDDDDDDDNQ
jgi:hypothetical protein